MAVWARAAIPGDQMAHRIFHGLLRPKLGLRKRRQSDSLRTFISLAQADGARNDILRWITNGPGGDIVSVYTTLSWNALCEEVAKLRITLRDGRLNQLSSSGELVITQSCVLRGQTAALGAY